MRGPNSLFAELCAFAARNRSRRASRNRENLTHGNTTPRRSRQNGWTPLPSHRRKDRRRSIGIRPSEGLPEARSTKELMASRVDDDMRLVNSWTAAIRNSCSKDKLWKDASVSGTAIAKIAAGR